MLWGSGESWGGVCSGPRGEAGLVETWRGREVKEESRKRRWGQVLENLECQAGGGTVSWDSWWCGQGACWGEGL